MCWETWEQREFLREREQAREQERRVEAETDEQATEPVPAEQDERELVPA